MTSIRRQLVLGLLVGLFVLFAIAGTVLYLSVRDALFDSFDAGLADKARALATLVRLEEGKVEFEFSEEPALESEYRRDRQYFEVWVDGTVLARSPSLGQNHLDRRSGSLAHPRIWSLELPQGRAGRAVGIHFFPSGDEEERKDNQIQSPSAQSRPKFTLVVARDRKELEENLTAVLSNVLVTGLLMPFGAVVIVLLVVQRGLRPLARVADQAATIEATSLARRFPAAEMPAELQLICGRLNDLLARLEASFERERRFTAAVAHELRTPIAELRSLAEVALKFAGEAEASASFFNDALDVARQMERLVTTLLSLARCEAGRQEVVRESVNLGRLAAEAWRPLEGQARQRGLQTTFDLPKPDPVTTDPAMVSTILSNLLSNAVEYTPSGGRIECRTSVRDAALELTLSNTVSHLTSDDLPHLSEPFWRKDPARSDSAHSGLGLTLVFALARLLGIDVRIELPSPDRLSISLRFPGEPPAIEAEATC